MLKTIRKVSEGLLSFLKFSKLNRNFCTSSLRSSDVNQSGLANSTSSIIIEDRNQNVRLIGINRPHKRNAIDRKTAQELRKAFEEFDKDPNSRVAVLHGIGGSFCAGYDLEELSAPNQDSTREHIRPAPMGPSWLKLSKPVIAAVDGYAVAGGLELALWCDLRVVEITAIMGVFCRRFGVPLIDGGTVRLTRLIGHSRALDLILTGRGINGKEAFDIGLANRLVPVGTALGQAFNLAQSLVKFPQECLRADRRSAYYAAFEAKSMEDALNFEFENGKPVIATESVQGARRFKHEGVGRHGKFVLDKMDYDVEVKA